MSMCGEVENLEREILVKKSELLKLEKRLDQLQKIIDERNQPLLNMHLDPAKRNWEYDGDGKRIPRDIS